MVENNIESSAFVYGCMSFFDKMCNGTIIILIQKLHDLQSAKTFYKHILSFTCGGSCILIILLVLSMWSTDKREKTGAATSDDAPEKTCLFDKIQSGQ